MLARMPHHILKKRKFEEMSDQNKKKKIRKNEETEEEEMEALPFDPFNLDKIEDESVFQMDNHIYFTADVSMKSVNKLAKLIHNSNKEYDILYSSVSHMANVTPKPLFLHITSVGGDLFAGFRAVDMIHNSRIPIYTVVEGYAISAGSLMYLAGQKKFMTKNSYLLIHQLSNYHGDGTSETFEKAKDEFSNNMMLMNQLYDFYIEVSKGKLTKKKVEDILKHDLYWNFTTCQKYGLVEDIYNSETNHKYSS
jgi:ATP-dependent Clp protease protease subunit